MTEELGATREADTRTRDARALDGADENDRLIPTLPPGVDADPEHFFERIAAITPAISYIFDLERMENVWANRSLFTHLGYTEAEVKEMGSDVLPRLMHPDDLDRYGAHFEALLKLGPLETARFEYRMRHKDGRWVWLHSHEAVYRRGENDLVRQIIGSAHDITQTKEASERVELVTAELRHRVKNIFTVASSMVSLAERGGGDPKEALATVRDRLRALSIAHDVAMNEIGDDHLAVDDLIERTLAPYREMAEISTETQPIAVKASLATPLGLIVHELATNATKYGGLRNPTSSLSLRASTEGNEVVLEWRETFEPPVDEAQLQVAKQGFGMRLIRQAVMQLSGTMERDLTTDGLAVTIRFRNKA